MPIPLGNNRIGHGNPSARRACFYWTSHAPSQKVHAVCDLLLLAVQSIVEILDKY